MTGRYFLVALFSVCLLQILEGKEDQGAIEKLFTYSVDAVNKTNTMLHSGFNATVSTVFKPLEFIGVMIEEGIVSATKNIGKLTGFVAKQIKNVAMKVQDGEEKFMGCVKSEQFDPVKEIFLDISTCVTGKADTISNIVQKSLTQVNSTYGVVKSLTMLPKCQNSKCFADYTSGIAGSIGKIALGLGSIGMNLVTGIAGIPATLPLCLISKPAMSPVKIFGLLGANIMKCFKG